MKAVIDNSDFIRSVSGKRKLRQQNFVRACRVLARIFPAQIPVAGKKSGDYTYVTITKKRALDMVEASLYSLYRNSEVVPSRVVIVSDGSWEPEYGVRYFARRGLKVECLTWQHCAEFYRPIIPELTVWAEKHIWGKKMAAILYVSETDSVLFSDPDVLWYGSPLQEEEWKSLMFKVSIDCCHSYDSEFIERTGSQYLYDTENPVNCGAVYIKGGLKLLNEKALDCIRYQAEHCGQFAEQTVFAIMDLQYNSRWSTEEVVSSVDDVIQPFFSRTIMYPNTVARHYLWRLKWIYWTEYYKMRLFSKKESGN